MSDKEIESVLKYVEAREVKNEESCPVYVTTVDDRFKNENEVCVKDSFKEYQEGRAV